MDCTGGAKLEILGRVEKMKNSFDFPRKPLKRRVAFQKTAPLRIRGENNTSTKSSRPEVVDSSTISEREEARKLSNVERKVFQFLQQRE